MIERVPLIGVQGNVKIETFDALTGKKKAETGGHNLFTNYGLERFRKYCAAAIGCQFGRNLYFNEADANEVVGNTNYDGWGILKTLYLTDNTAAITADSLTIPGVLTGYADRTPYAGPTANRGSINQAETAFTKDGLKAVFDFATDKANGTHKSIFWGDQVTINTYNIAAQVLSSGIQYSLARNYACFVEADDGYFYGSVGTKLYKIDPTTLAEIATYTLPAEPVDTAIFDVSGGYCYFTTSAYSTTLYVFKLSDSTNSTITLPYVSSTEGGAVIGGYLYYPYAGTKIYKINLSDGTSEYKSIALLSVDNFIRRCGSDLYVIPYPSSSIRAAKYDYAANALTNTNCYLTTSTCYSSFSLINKLWYKRKVDSYYGGGNSIATYQLLQQDLTKGRANMITGKVLDTPITKANTQTMKVTYTISFA